DLRSLKNTIRLHHLTAKSNAMMEKELLIAITAYNIVRAVMGWAAQQAGNSPRSLSFSQVQDVVEAALPVLAAAESLQEYALAFQYMLDTAAHFRLPTRSHRRAYPRLIWGHHRSFPKRTRVHLALPRYAPFQSSSRTQPPPPDSRGTSRSSTAAKSFASVCALPGTLQRRSLCY